MQDLRQPKPLQVQGERLPVVSRDRPARLLGVVYKSDLLERYSQLKRALDGDTDFVLPARRDRS